MSFSWLHSGHPPAALRHPPAFRAERLPGLRARLRQRWGCSMCCGASSATSRGRARRHERAPLRTSSRRPRARTALPRQRPIPSFPASTRLVALQQIRERDGGEPAEGRPRARPLRDRRGDDENDPHGDQGGRLQVRVYRRVAGAEIVPLRDPPAVPRAEPARAAGELRRDRRSGRRPAPHPPHRLHPDQEVRAPNRPLLPPSPLPRRRPIACARPSVHSTRARPRGRGRSAPSEEGVGI